MALIVIFYPFLRGLDEMLAVCFPARTCTRAPRIISNLQGRCGHEKAAEEAAEQENLISTIDEIV